ncbi:chitinase, partial [Aeromonas australiensis]|nr:chitinase [Aeromonas australiensis]
MLVALAAAPLWVQAAYPAYQAGTAYKAGDIVSNVGSLYECKEFPYSGWCGASPYHYAPGVGVVWTDAWKPYGGEGPPPALGVAVSSPAAGGSFNEGASGALAGTPSGPATALARVGELVDGQRGATAGAPPRGGAWGGAGGGGQP